MIIRRKSKQISIGNVKIGGDAPISVQSMCNTDTRDVEKTLEQINQFACAGCEIARLAVLNRDAAKYYVSHGVSRIVLARECSKEDIKDALWGKELTPLARHA